MIGDSPPEKRSKTCVILNEQLGGLTLGLIHSHFLPLSVSCITDEDAYLLRKNLPDLTVQPKLEQMQAIQDGLKVDLVAYNLSHKGVTHTVDWRNSLIELEILFRHTTFPNYLVAINAKKDTSTNTKINEAYNNLAKILSDRKYYVSVLVKKYRAFGGSEARYNTFITGTTVPLVKLYVRDYKFSTNLSAPATTDFIKALKIRNGYPENWQLDVLNDVYSFEDQEVKLKRSVLPTLVKMIADEIYIWK